MRQYFSDISKHLRTKNSAGEVFLANYSGETSDFVRLNGGLVRQAGQVTQRELGLRLIRGKKQCEFSVSLGGIWADDQLKIDQALMTMRTQLDVVPEDPHLLYSETVASAETTKPNLLTKASDMVDGIVAEAKGLDLVGLLASGGIYRGFANSFGQVNWFETYSFNFDYSVYLRGDKAVKGGFAGFEWNTGEWQRRIADARSGLENLARDPVVLKPGSYRVYLTPDAVAEVLTMLAWGGFGLEGMKTKQSCLQKMYDEGKTLNGKVTIRENTAEGVAPNFSGMGYITPPSVTLIENGKYKESLVSARSAKEYGATPNCSNSWEHPRSLDMAGGSLSREDILKKLDTGLYISNLHYLNFSDRPQGRLTGMTRFATYWVEGGKIKAPVNVMRFDDTIYRMLGEELVDLTSDRDMIFDNSTYGGRSTSSWHVPGALLSGKTFTL